METLKYKSCQHCGSECISPIANSSGEVFCCHGCRSVYSILQGSGLSSFYKIRAQDAEYCPTPVFVDKSDYEYFDDVDFIKAHTLSKNEMEFFLKGIQCTSCLWLIENLPQLCPDAEMARVNLSDNTVLVRRKPGGSYAKIAQSLASLGYTPQALSEKSEIQQLQKQQQHLLLKRIGVAAFGVSQIMILAVAVYAGARDSLKHLFDIYSGLIALPVLSYSAWPIYQNVWQSLKNKSLSLDLPIALAIVAGGVLSYSSLIFSSQSKLYFDSISMLIFLLLSSRYLLSRSQQNLFKPQNLLELLTYSRVQLFQNNKPGPRVRSSELKPGEFIMVKAPMTLPVDAEVISGEALFNTASMTGEYLPQRKGPQSLVEAGYICTEGQVIAKVLKSTSQTRLSDILTQAQFVFSHRPEESHFASAVGRFFTGTVLLLSATLFVYFLSQGQALEGFERTLALLIVSCPCVFGMAIPLALTLSVHSAYAQGIVIKKTDLFEKLLSIKNFFFDKTGTLTQGEMQVRHHQALAPTSSLPQCFSAALALESHSQHPVAHAICGYLKNLGVSSLPITGIQTLPAGGLQGFLAGDIYKIYAELTPEPSFGDNSVNSASKSNPAQSNSPSDSSRFIGPQILLTKNDSPQVRFVLEDSLRPSAKATIDSLKLSGINSHILSGDQEAPVKNCAHQLELSPQSQVYFRKGPEEKAKTLAKFSGEVAMIGDGVNDSLAMAKAHASIAVSGPIAAAIQNADAYLMHGNLNLLTQLLSESQKLRNTLKACLLSSGTYNLAAGFLAIMGLMTPMFAAILMPLSSFTVLAITLTSLKIKRRRK